MKNQFILNVLAYFVWLFVMHLLIQAILMISTNVYAGAAISAFIVLLFSVLLADKDR
jgi:multisubunit Na+/H+ antiporter MnhE subunit